MNAMSKPISIQAFAMAINAILGRAAVCKALKETKIELSDLHWRMHPAQVCSISLLFEAVAITDVQEANTLEDFPSVKRLAKEFLPVTFLSIPIEQDSEASNSVIDLLDGKGNLVCRIHNLAIPIGFGVEQ